jgi:hypothetical protein
MSHQRGDLLVVHGFEVPFVDRIALPRAVMCKGFQKLWNLPPEVERQVLAQL